MIRPIKIDYIAFCERVLQHTHTHTPLFIVLPRAKQIHRQEPKCNCGKVSVVFQAAAAAPVER